MRTLPPQWTGILFGLTGDIKGIKVKIETSYAVRDHFLVRSQASPMAAMPGGYCPSLLCVNAESH